MNVIRAPMHDNIRTSEFHDENFLISIDLCKGNTTQCARKNHASLLTKRECTVIDVHYERYATKIVKCEICQGFNGQNCLLFVLVFIKLNACNILFHCVLLCKLSWRRLCTNGNWSMSSSRYINVSLLRYRFGHPSLQVICSVKSTSEVSVSRICRYYL